MEITLREARADDEQFLREVYACTRADEMALVPWTDAQRAAFLKMQFDAQNSHYRERFPRASFDVIQADGEPVGRLYVSREEELIRILDIVVLPARRNAGIGTSLIDALLKEAAELSKMIEVYVETYNPSLGLFERRGFKRLDQEGVNLLLQWQPASGGPQLSDML
jgi:GNAT superfamily N-acetyltransferase